MPYEKVRQKIFGIGGNGYIPKYFELRRCKFRISICVYRDNGAIFAGDMYDYFEGLTQMDELDARQWFSRWSRKFK